MDVLGRRMMATLAALSIFASGAAHALMVGYPGEALLVPFAVFGTNSIGSDSFNTTVVVTVPEDVALDTLPNDYTARNTTQGGSYTFPGPSQTVRWYFFAANGALGAQGSFSVAAETVYTFDLRAEMADLMLTAAFENVPGYLVFGTDTARSGGAANFVMYGDAYFTTCENTNAPPGDFSNDICSAALPVMAMSDGPDTAGVGPRIGNAVIYAGAIPSRVSPLISGIRLSNGDGDEDDTVRFDVGLRADPNSFAETSTLMVVWLDANYNHVGVPLEVVDTMRGSCTTSVSLPSQLNLLYVFDDSGTLRVNPTPFTYGLTTSTLPTLCSLPGTTPPATAKFELPEGTDEGPGTGATSGGVAFSLLFGNGTPEAAGVPTASAPYIVFGHDRAKVNN